MWNLCRAGDGGHERGYTRCIMLNVISVHEAKTECNFSTNNSKRNHIFNCGVRLLFRCARDTHTWNQFRKFNNSFRFDMSPRWYPRQLVCVALVLLTITISYYLLPKWSLCNRCCKDSVVWALIDIHKETFYVYTHTHMCVCVCV